MKNKMPFGRELRSVQWACAIFVALLSACSTTKNLPEEEQLYIGIDDITYEGVPRKWDKKAVRDSAGVIASIGSAVHAVGDVLKGDGRQGVSARRDSLWRSLSSEQRAALRARHEADLADFEKAKAEVEAVLAYPPNDALFGSSSLRSPFPIGLWIYNGFAKYKKGLGRWIFRKFAAKPVYVSSVSPDMRVRVATNTLHNYGYFSGKVSYELLPQKDPKKAKILYHVYAGPLHRLDSIAYQQFTPVADSLLRATADERLLRKGDAFNVVNLADEQTRIEKLFRENGYYFYSAPYTTYRADTLMRRGYVQLQVRPAPERPARVRHPWYIGNTYVAVRRSEGDPLDKVLRRRDYTYTYSGSELPLRPNMWRRSINHRKGELFRLSDSDLTLEKLNSLGVFSQMNVDYIPRDTTAGCDTLDVYVSAVMDKLYDSSFEMNATLKSNQQVGPGVSFSIAKRNAFGSGEKVSFKIFGSYEWQSGSGRGERNSLLNSYELGTELSFDFPRFLFPGISRRHTRFPATTTFALNADWKNRAGFFNMITFGVDAKYAWHKRSTSQHELTLFSLDFDKMLHRTATFDSIMDANPALYASMRDQFIPSISYTYTYTSSAGHRNPVWLQLSAKESGNLVSGLYAAAGRGLNERDKKLFGSPFAQFVKLTAEVHETFRLNARFNVATRLFAGAIFSFGNSLRAPYSEQFYVGGANSVRAFTVRTIGPGSFRSDNDRYAYIDQTGDFKLEANAELRAHLFGSLHGAVFLDVGNVWLLRDDPLRPGGKLSRESLKHIAVGTGLGLRYDLQFLVLRFDVGIGLHAPYETRKSGFYNLERFKDGFAFHFAIGYPF